MEFYPQCPHIMNGWNLLLSVIEKWWKLLVVSPKLLSCTVRGSLMSRLKSEGWSQCLIYLSTNGSIMIFCCACVVSAVTYCWTHNMWTRFPFLLSDWKSFINFIIDPGHTHRLYTWVTNYHRLFILRWSTHRHFLFF